MITYGLIGYPLSHSWSAEWFSARFIKENNTHSRYLLFPLERLDELPGFIRNNPDIHGLNVTIPHKVKILNFLNELDETAEKIGAVNTIRVDRKSGVTILKGYNTDAAGFRLSIDLSKVKKALILGTGGASKAVAFTLINLAIDFLFVSRNPTDNSTIHYTEITKEIIHSHPLIINTTPIGMYPDIGYCPPIPYQWITRAHYLYDLVYNPQLSLFLKKGSEQGAVIQNGEKMLFLQAEESLKIWEKRDAG